MIGLTGTTANDQLGTRVATGDLNNDGFSEILAGAKGYTGGESNGAVYIGYLYIDADGDGAVSFAGLLSTIDSSFTVDCDDTNASILEGLTLYADVDGDTLGDPNSSISTCSATDGYVENADDTNDTIPNNGIEIDGDGIDNDGDSLIDENNTIADNGEHPYYGSLSPTDTAAVSENITSVVGSENGMITVTYEDGSVYDYDIYDSTASSDTNVKQYQTTGYAIVLHKKGKKVYLVNLYNGDIADKVTIKKAGFTKAAMVLKDLRSNNKNEVVVTGKKKAKVTLAIVKVNVDAATLKKSDSETITNNKVVVTKTKATSKKIKLRSAKNKALVTFKVTKKYKLKLVS